MGMSASQARLLTLTSRLHDIEYKAQNIQSQKIALATQKDELYQAYCDALDAKKIQVAFNNGDGTRNFVDASFATLCGYSNDRFKQYSLVDARSGKVIVSEETAQMYEDFGNDKYSFAWAMLGFDGNFCWNYDYDGCEVGIGTSQCSTDGNCLMTEVEQVVYDMYSTDEDLSEAYADVEEALDNGDTSQQKEALEKFRDILYGNTEYRNEIYKYMCYNKNDDKDKVIANSDFDYDPDNFPSDEFNYYVQLFEQIQSAGGCTTIDPRYESGEEGELWLNNMITSGLVLIEVYNNDSKEWQQTSVATSTNANYLQEVQDETDLKKAEAEYEHELDIINTKDTKYDQDLSKLETERTSITTEIDSIKTVRDDNIDRTFGIFS